MPCLPVPSNAPRGPTRLIVRCLFVRCLFVRCLFVRCLIVRCLPLLACRSALLAEWQSKGAESDRVASEQSAACEAAQGVAESAVRQRDAAAAAAEELRSRLAESEARHAELQQEYLKRPAPAAKPPAAAAKPVTISPGEAELRALRSELDGWKLVTEQAQAMQQKAERELKSARMTISQVRYCGASTPPCRSHLSLLRPYSKPPPPLTEASHCRQSTPPPDTLHLPSAPPARPSLRPSLRPFFAVRGPAHAHRGERSRQSRGEGGSEGRRQSQRGEGECADGPASREWQAPAVLRWRPR